MEEEVRRGHRHDHVVIVQGLLEVAYDAVALGRTRIERDEIVIMEADAPGSKFRKLLDDIDGIESRAHEIAEGVATAIANGLETKTEFVRFFRCVLVAGSFLGSILWY